MANTANADKCEIVCTPIEVVDEKGKDKLIAEKRNGRFSIQEGENEQELKLTPGKLTDKFKNRENYAKVLAKQKTYKKKIENKDARNNETERE